ncbi:MAG: hypothetical protein IT298_08485 [Chloroflexi bacterium]|jgi:cell division protein FtsB|nr:MAG: hypothetical protein UZ13_00518 [Chloroflexi bacterium OLB13]MBC6955058.1 hypothetical protein [Chloroflexota bacterium]MBW7879990.1 hypothetical protein [Anaerolineae bacterium]MDL1916578.1 hypothetical protein [Anaerolineae bacterium CFX4]OQY89244.1 MAG: hypothetical protein B6D39_09755 [Anaerolineae bacterium UTCFX2]
MSSENPSPSGHASHIRQRQRPAIRANSQVSSLQIMFAVVLAVGLLLTVNFSARIAQGRPLQEAYELVQLEIAQLETEQADLLAERDYSLSDFYVENWARGRGKMIRPGDKLFVPIPSRDSATPTPVPYETGEFDSGVDQPQTWEMWWSLFFDGPPPLPRE